MASQSSVRAGSPAIPMALIFAFAIAASLNLFLAFLFESPFSSISSLVLYVWLIAILFRIDGRAGCLLLPSALIRASVMVSLVAIEFGGYMSELGRSGEPGHFSATMLLYNAVFLFASAFLLRLILPDIRGSSLQESPFGADIVALLAFGVVAACGLAILYLLAYGASTGFPLIQGVDRFVYRRYSADTVVLYLLGFKFVTSALLGWSAFAPKVPSAARTGAISVFVMSIVAYFLMGDKFFTVLVSMVFFVMTYIIFNSHRSVRLLVVFLPFGLVFVLLLFGVTYYIYSQGNALGFEETFTKISERVTGQGQLWYAAEITAPDFWNWDSEFISRNLYVLTSDNQDVDNMTLGLGPFYFAYRFSPDNLIRSILNNAGTVSFTSAFEPLGLIFFGRFGLVFVMLFAAILNALLLRYVYYAISIGSPFSIAFSTLIYLWLDKVLTQGTPNVLFGVQYIKHYVIILTWEIGQAALLARRYTAPRLLPNRRAVRS